MFRLLPALPRLFEGNTGIRDGQRAHIADLFEARRQVHHARFPVPHVVPQILRERRRRQERQTD
jgi:hypothetical protein